jgi:hypothetical protein
MALFTPVPCAQLYTATRIDLAQHAEPAHALRTLPSGDCHLWSIPFILGPGGMDTPSFVTVAEWTTASIEVPVDGTASYVLFAHFSDAGDRLDAPGARDPRDPGPAVTAPGEVVGSYTLRYESGAEQSRPIRRRFEIGGLVTPWGREPFAARTHHPLILTDPAGPIPAGEWGQAQSGVRRVAVTTDPDPRIDYASRVARSAGTWLIYALPNPNPAERIRAVRIERIGAAMITVGGLTLFTGRHHPLRYERLATMAVQATAGAPIDDRITLDLDLGLIACRHRPLQVPACATPTTLLDVMATRDSVLRLAGTEIPLGPAYDGSAAKSEDGRWQLRAVTGDRTWVRARIVDADTGRPLAARVHLRSEDGIYHPPHGHRRKVNTRWFEDYGADLQLGDTPFAYVDGDFTVELPVGRLHLEAAHGFEYEPLAGTVTIDPGQRELVLSLRRFADLRATGWVTGDTHVHFLSPETARLEAAAEGVDVVNLLAAQWGEMVTNMGDITGRPSGCSTNETIIWVGTEHRQHLLGHLSLLGVRGSPVVPLNSGGPDEGWVGDPVMRGLAEWADECRAKGGLAVAPHFPFPHAEVVADVVLGKIDAVELGYWWAPTLDDFATREWYRLLGCGYRVPAVGGTDKMSARTPIGGARTYAFIGDRELSFDSWASAVRSGRTFVTTGPLITLSVEGRGIGDEILLPADGGALTVIAEVVSTVPLTGLEIVVNGTVVAAETSADGARRLSVTTSLSVRRSGWIAARCGTGTFQYFTLPTQVAAHTSPIYVTVGQDRPFDPMTGEYLITLMQGGLEWLHTLATPESPERQRAIAAIFEEGIEAIRSRHG